jgi:hypothetical protein
MKKRSVYSTPRLLRHGSVEKITKGSSTGAALDATFVIGTAFSSLTFYS